MKPLIPLDLLMRSVIVPLIPSLIHVSDWMKIVPPSSLPTSQVCSDAR